MADLAGGAVLVVHTLVRGFVPIAMRPGSRWGVVAVCFEMSLGLAVVATTGDWDSPFVFSLVPPIAAAGFGRGFGLSLRLAGASVVSVGAVSAITSHAPQRVAVVWASELILVALVAGYARRLFVDAEARASQAIEEMSRLAEANALLAGLHRLTQGLPASLDLGATVNSTIGRAREMVSAESAAVLLREADQRDIWTVAAAEGLRLGPSIAEADLVPPLREAIETKLVVLVRDLGSHEGPGLGFRSESGIYAPLVARGQVIGVLAVESTSKGRLTKSDADAVRGLTDQAALSIDNARWFARLRTVGADEERTRIARELHDRVGSSLAYLGFELDRIVRTVSEGQLLEQLSSLRQDVRRVVGEVRDTLYDLRTDVSESVDLSSTLGEFLDRVSSRSDMQIALDVEASARLPILQEREMWRIAQEAITNAERHSRSSVLRVRWFCSEERAELTVTDEGMGLPPASAHRFDSYGMLGMRERADAIGAQLEITSKEGRGTTVRCTLEMS